MTLTILLGLLLGLGLDLLIGWPAWLYARIGHPVGWIARPISALERRLNRAGRSDAARFTSGALVSLGAIALSVLVWGGLALALGDHPLAAVGYGLLFWPLIAARSMHTHVAAIAKPLEQKDIEAARSAVSMIVGRDPKALNEAGIARAALESLGENTSDGVVAPLFWGVIFGPAGMAGYKAINTLDSMIAHRNPRYEWFGKLAARVDDLANLLPARLTGVLYALAAGAQARRAFAVMWRDAGKHRSPNAGWPESALAAGVGVRLSGPRKYGDRIVTEPWLNPQAPDPTAASIRKGLQIYRRVIGLLAVMGAGLTLAAFL